jgi:hypothetical protein
MICLFKSFEIKKNTNQYHMYSKRAAQVGNVFWSRQLSMMYRIGYFGYEQNEKKGDSYDEIGNSKQLSGNSCLSPGL